MRRLRRILGSDGCSWLSIMRSNRHGRTMPPAEVHNRQTLSQERTKNDAHWIPQSLGSAGPGWRYLGNHQYFSKFRFEREETALDPRGVAAAAARLDIMVSPRTKRQQKAVVGA